MNQKSIRDKMIKRIMQLEKELWMPKHIPAGTEEDPKPADMREFTQQEIDDCGCSNCKYPYEYWNEKTEPFHSICPQKSLQPEETDLKQRPSQF